MNSHTKSKGAFQMAFSAFRIPNDIVFGEGALDYLTTLKGNRAIIVTCGNSMRRFGFLVKTKELL